eukprot:5182183-Pyramimonas_sp.AAC.1
MKVTAFTPYAASRSERLEDISITLRDAYIVLLGGTHEWAGAEATNNYPVTHPTIFIHVAYNTQDHSMPTSIQLRRSQAPQGGRRPEVIRV